MTINPQHEAIRPLQEAIRQPQIVATAWRSGLNGGDGSYTVLHVPRRGGVYRYNLFLVVTTLGAAGSATINIRYRDVQGTATVTNNGTVDPAVVGASAEDVRCMRVLSGYPIEYAFVYGGGSGGNIEVSVVLEEIQ